jgi:hypothetical protein
MTVHRIKLKDLDIHFLEKLKEQYQDENLEIEIRINTDQGDCADKEMNEELFWAIIEKFDWEKEGEDRAVIEPAVDFLSQCSIQNIKAFQDILSEKLYRLDGEKYARHIGEYAYGKVRHFSVDLFLYARSCVVANGREFYYHVLDHPEDMPKDLTFEAILNVADLAFQRKTGFEMEYVPSHNYETFFNEDGWELTTTEPL